MTTRVVISVVTILAALSVACGPQDAQDSQDHNRDGTAARNPTESTIEAALTENGRYRVVAELPGSFTGSDGERIVTLVYEGARGLDRNRRATDRIVAVANGVPLAPHLGVSSDNPIDYSDSFRAKQLYLSVWVQLMQIYSGVIGVAGVGDFNENGYDEIALMQLSGSSFVPAIFEYHDGEFKEIMPHAERGAITLGISAPAPGEFYVYEPDYETGDNEVRVRFHYRWNEELVEYELIEQTRISRDEFEALDLPTYSPANGSE